VVCIDPWLLKQRRKCPNCKRKIIFADERRPPPDSDSSTDDERTPLLRSSSENNAGAEDSPECERNEHAQEFNDNATTTTMTTQEVTFTV